MRLGSVETIQLGDLAPTLFDVGADEGKDERAHIPMASDADAGALRCGRKRIRKGLGG
jgi:hypothetical protein